MKRLKLLFSLFFIFYSFYCLKATNIIDLDENTEYLYLNHQVYCYEDFSNNLKIQEILSGRFDKDFKINNYHSLNFGFSTADYWLKFCLANKTQNSNNWYLEFCYPLLDRLELYYLDSNKNIIKKECGDIFPFYDRDILYKNFVFDIPIPKQDKKTFYIKASGNSSKQFPMKIWNPDKFYNHLNLENLLFGLYYGFIIAMLFHNFIIFIGLKDKLYLYYVLNIIINGLFFISFNGFGFFFLWSNHPDFQQIAMPLFMNLMVIIIGLFVREYFKLKEIYRTIDRIFIILLIVASILSLLLFVWNDIHTIMNMSIVLSAIHSIVVLTTCIIGLIHGLKSAKIFFFAWLTYIFGCFLLGFMCLGLIDNSFINNYLMQLASAIQVIFLSFSLTEKINTSKKEKVLFQEQAISNLEKAKLMIQENNKILEQKVEERTQQLIEKNRIIEQSNLDLSKKNKQILISNQKLESLNNELTNKNSLITDQNTELELLISDLAEKNMQILEQNKELENLINDLADANAAKDKFFTIISHDLKNPLQALITLSDILINYYKQIEAAQFEDYLNKIHTTSINLSTLLENLLQWARSQTGKIEFSPQKVLLKKLVDDSIKILKSNSEKKNIKVFNNIHNDLWVNVDTNMMSTIFRNLISNAIKFTSINGEVKISAIRTKNKENVDSIEITVLDNGSGISGEMQEKLFKIDSHISSNGTNHETGTGLGLIICKEFINKHNGTIWVESSLGNGSAFKFILPE